MPVITVRPSAAAGVSVTIRVSARADVSVTAGTPAKAGTLATARMLAIEGIPARAGTPGKVANQRCHHQQQQHWHIRVDSNIRDPSRTVTPAENRDNIHSIFGCLQHQGRQQQQRKHR